MNAKPYSILSRGERAFAASLGSVIALGIVATTLVGFVVSTNEPEMPLVRVEPIVLTADRDA